jgi:hypothetical protein
VACHAARVFPRLRGVVKGLGTGVQHVLTLTARAARQWEPDAVGTAVPCCDGFQGAILLRPMDAILRSLANGRHDPDQVRCRFRLHRARCGGLARSASSGLGTVRPAS